MQKAQLIIDQWLKLNNNQLWLSISSLGLETLPPIPDNCLFLDCSDNKLTKLPNLFNCQNLNCINNQLVGLPELPNCTYLNCSNNKLVTLPDLPNCTALYCTHNNLVKLPDLPVCQLLKCSHNKLQTLPDLPKCDTLYCDSNKLTVLPELLECDRLIVAFNQLTSLPRLKDGCLLDHTEDVIPVSTCKCMEFKDNNNKYLYISQKQLNHLRIARDTKFDKNTKMIKYNDYAKVIQRAFRMYLKRKYFGDILRYLVKGPSGIVWGYAF
jgi:hypothetical protein